MVILLERPTPTCPTSKLFRTFQIARAIADSYSRLKQVDYRDTFLDWQHLIESLPGKTVEPSDDVNGSFGPPYVLQTIAKPTEEAPAKTSKKRRRDAEPTAQVQPEAIQVCPPLIDPNSRAIPATL